MRCYNELFPWKTCSCKINENHSVFPLDKKLIKRPVGQQAQSIKKNGALFIYILQHIQLFVECLL